MKNFIKILTAVFLLLIVFPSRPVMAATGGVSISGPTALYPGETGTYRITFSSSETAFFKYSISGSNLTLSGPLNSEVLGDGESRTETVTITATAQAVGAGTSIYVSGTYAATGASAAEGDKPISNSLAISVIARPPVKSGNNFLKSLTVSHGSLGFNRNTNNYTVTVDHSVSSIAVGAAAEDSSASVSGTGTRNLQAYSNSIPIRVTAENGAVRDYYINVIRKDEDGNSAPLSKNNNLESLSIDGCKFEFNPDKLDYECEVGNLVDKVDVKAVAADSTATAKVSNIDKLKVGPNEIQIVVTSESKDEKIYKINVTRSSDAPTVEMEDLEASLKNLTADGITVVADEKGILNKSVLETIKASKKILYVKKVDEEGKTIYQWKFDGAKIDNIQDVNLKLSFDSKIGDNIDKLSNYAKGLILSFENNPTLPTNTEVGVFVGSEYTDSSLLNLYFYDSETDELSLEQKDLKVTEGFVWFKLDHTSEYFLTPSTIQGVKNPFDYWMVSTISLAVLSLLMIVITLLQRNKLNAYKKRVSDYTSI